MAFRLDKLTIKAREAVQAAQNLATDCGHQEIDGVHVLAALLAQKEGVVNALLQKLGTDRGALLGDVQRELERRPKVSGGQQYLSAALNATFEKAWPNGCVPTLAACRKAVRLGLDLGWAARWLLSPPALKAYDEARAPALKAYNEACATAWKAYY